MQSPPEAKPPARLRILLRTARAQSDEWRTALAQALPDADIAVWPDVPFAPDYVVAWRPSTEFFNRVASPKAIFNLGAGVEALLRLPNLPPDVPVIRLEDAGMAQQMAQYVTLAVLAAHRQRNAYASAQREGRWAPLPPVPSAQFAVGFLGLGVLGRACADALRRLGYPLLGWSREPKQVPGVESFSGMGALPQLLSRSRVLVCLLPATPHTIDLLDATRLALLPRGAHVVNVSRGDLVVDHALIALLDAGHLAGATLDVFRTEPLPPAHPFWHHPRIAVTPHISATTQVAEAVAQVAAKIRLLERGQAVTGAVDRALGY